MTKPNLNIGWISFVHVENSCMTDSYHKKRLIKQV